MDRSRKKGDAAVASKQVDCTSINTTAAVTNVAETAPGAADDPRKERYFYPYTQLRTDGIWHYPTKADGSAYLAPIRLSAPFSVIGSGRDIAGKNYYIIKYGDNERCLIARGLVGTNEGWTHLRNYIDIPSKKQKLDLLTEYVQKETPPETWSIADTAGWHGDAYVMPSGEIIGKIEQRLYFNGRIADDKRRAYCTAGTLEDWREHIGRYATGNSRFCLMLGVAFAAPLILWLNIDGGIFHIYGDSSSGKTTIQRAAQSVWGHGKAACESWNTTAYAVTNNAAARNDGFLSLDEMGEDRDGKAVDQGTYSLANGKGRTQGAKDGGNRPEIRFRVLSTSTGEITLENHLDKFGRAAMAGQLVRCPSIRHKLENHHNFKTSLDFVKHLQYAAEHYYGVAGRAYISYLLKDKIHWTTIAQKAYQKHLNNMIKAQQLNDQLKRTAGLFAAAMVGLELAIEFEIVPLTQEDAQNGIQQCFIDWLRDNITSDAQSIETSKIIRNAVSFMESQNLFFIDPEHPGYLRPNFPGYVKGGQYYVFANIFKSELCKGFDENQVKEVLHNIGWLEKDTKNRWQIQLYGTDYRTGQRQRLGRFYCFNRLSPDDTASDDGDLL